ncbi:hypothetical protein V6R21_11900 [Limibacter armeniacum]
MRIMIIFQLAKIAGMALVGDEEWSIGFGDRGHRPFGVGVSLWKKNPHL